MNQKIIFVYNAKSGAMHGIKDLLHKSVKPSTYPCKLCQVTFSGATMNKLWKEYVSALGIPTIFLHKNEFVKIYSKVNIKFPAILLKTDGSIKMLLSADDFKKIRGLPDLMSTLNDKLLVVAHSGIDSK